MVLAALAFTPMMFSHYQEAVLLPLLPWCLLALHHLWHGARLVNFAVVGVLVLAVKAQMAFMLPFLLGVLCLAWRRGDFKLLPVLACGLMFTVVAAGLVFIQRHHGQENSYNRFFNGLGWTVQGVAHWPARTFNDRQAYFDAHRQTLQVPSDGLEPISGQRWMGTSYWPDGMQLERMPVWNIVASTLSTRQWSLRMMGSPPLVWAWVTSAWEVALTSSYALDYLRPPEVSTALLQPVRQALLAHAGWLWLVAVLASVAACLTVAWPLKLNILFAMVVSVLICLGLERYTSLSKPHSPAP